MLRPVRGIGFWGPGVGKIVVLLVLLMTAAQLPAQRWTGFWRLTGPEKCWVMGHLRVAQKAQYISIISSQIADSVREKHKLGDNWNGGLPDAFRHSLWMAMTAREIGAKKAEKLGRAHEKGNYRTWKKSQLEDGVLADAAATEMDLWNNQQGIEVAQELGAGATNQDLIAAILQRMADGKLRIIKMDDEGNCLDESGKVIPKEEWYGLWENERCLMESYLN